jgi:hypothetical protein
MLSLVALSITVVISICGIGFEKFSTVMWERQSKSIMYGIGYSVDMYRSDHDGELPQRLSQLVPQYLESRHAFTPQSWPLNAFIPLNVVAKSQLIDVFSIYAIEPLSDGGFVIYEKPSEAKNYRIGFSYRAKTSVKPNPHIVWLGRVTPERFGYLVLHNFIDKD